MVEEIQVATQAHQTFQDITSQVREAIRASGVSEGICFLFCLLFSEPTASVSTLAPLYFRHRIARPVSCYAFFKGWLLLSQPPGCLSNPTSFST